MGVNFLCIAYFYEVYAYHGEQPMKTMYKLILESHLYKYIFAQNNTFSLLLPLTKKGRKWIGIICKVITNIKISSKYNCCESENFPSNVIITGSEQETQILGILFCFWELAVNNFYKWIFKKYIICEFRILHWNCKSKRVLNYLKKGPKVGITLSTCGTFDVTFVNQIKNNSCSKKFHHFSWPFSFNYLNEIQNSFNFICHQRCYSFVSVVNYLKHPFPTAEICKSNQRDGAVLTWNKPLGASAHFSWKGNAESDEMGNIFNHEYACEQWMYSHRFHHEYRQANLQSCFSKNLLPFYHNLPSE